MIQHVTQRNANTWQRCTFLTCSVLPVSRACNLHCPFCFSRSSISSLNREQSSWQSLDVARYYEFARAKGATRLVITGGGEPLLRPRDVLYLIELGSRYFDEIACFTNGTFLTARLARQLADAGLSYLCYSRHHQDDAPCRKLMGGETPRLDDFFAAVGTVKVRATCVMARDYVDTRQRVWDYIHRLAENGVREFTFKHTYVAYDHSVFGNSVENDWARRHQVDFDPFAKLDGTVGRLPWGPVIKRTGDYQVCYYYEPTPDWEQEHQLCRSVNLLSNGEVYASLEDVSSRLFQLSNC